MPSCRPRYVFHNGAAPPGPAHLLLRSEENVPAACHSEAMTSETDGPPNQPWQPPSDYPRSPEQAPEAPEQAPGSGPAWQAPSTPPPGGGQGGAGRYGAGQYARQAAAYGAAGPDFMQSPFVLAPKPGIVPLRPLGVTEIISGAFEALRANPRAMFLPALIVMSIVGLLSAAVTFLATRAQLDALAALPATSGTSADDTELALETFRITGVTSLVQLGPSLLLSLVSTILTGLLIMTVSRSVLGRIATPGEVWARVRPRIWPLIGQSMVIGVISLVAALFSLGLFVTIVAAIISALDGDPNLTAIMVGVLVLFILTLVFIIVAVYLTIRLSFSSAALILENVGVWEGMRRSWHLTKGSFWRVLGILLLALLITGTLVGIVSGALGLVSGLTAVGRPGPYATAMAASSFLSSFLQAAVLPFTSAVVALTYIDLRMRKEGLDVELRRAAGV